MQIAKLQQRAPWHAVHGRNFNDEIFCLNALELSRHEMILVSSFGVHFNV
jgi:hypothetical protein